jgi:O-antigen ligase
MYLHVLVEVGIVGLALFGIALLLAVAATVRAARAFRRSGDEQMELLSRSLFAGLVGILAADFFLSGQWDRALWIIIGLALAAGSIARHSAREAEAETAPWAEPESERRVPVPAGMG